MSNRSVLGVLVACAAAVALAYFYARNRKLTVATGGQPAAPQPGSPPVNTLAPGTVVPASYATTHAGAYDLSGNGILTVSSPTNTPSQRAFHGTATPTAPPGLPTASPPAATASAIKPNPVATTPDCHDEFQFATKTRYRVCTQPGGNVTRVQI